MPPPRSSPPRRWRSCSARCFSSPSSRRASTLPALRSSFRGLVAAFKKRELWIVGLFLFLYYFSPGLSTPLYYTMTDSLKFPQGYIGILGSISSAGWIVGALLYRRLFGDLSSKRLLQLSIALGTVTTAAYLLLVNELSAAILSFCGGFAAMLATVATITLAADYSPQRAEGFSFAVMMSLINLASSSADNVGSFLFEHVFHQRADAAHSGVGGLHRLCLRARSAPASRRQAAGPAGGRERGGGSRTAGRVESLRHSA